jgi:CheY-like chemotaxis protein
MPGESILIVDDTLVTLKLTRIFLASQGYHILTASSAEEALEVLRDHHPHLVLTDIQLPGIDGLELTRRIKSSGATRAIPVVALAAFADAGEEQDALKAGCDACISRPVEPRALGLRVRQFLGDHSLEPAVEPGHPDDVL